MLLKVKIAFYQLGHLIKTIIVPIYMYYVSIVKILKVLNFLNGIIGIISINSHICVLVINSNQNTDLKIINK